jgi:hypothetical protein
MTGQAADKRISPTLEELASRIRLLEDERDIRAAIDRYGHAIDYGLEAEWADVFTPDAVFTVRMLRDVTPDFATTFPFAEILENGFRLRGRKALTAFAALHTRPPEAYHKHMVSDFVVKFEGPDTARVTTYAFRIDGHIDTREIIAFGRHIDKVVRCPDGRWRIAERLYEMESNGVPRGGIARTVAP